MVVLSVITPTKKSTNAHGKDVGIGAIPRAVLSTTSALTRVTSPTNAPIVTTDPQRRAIAPDTLKIYTRTKSSSLSYADMCVFV